MTEQPLLRAHLNGNFPAQLYFVLSEMAADGLEHIASWQPHGRSFKVHDRKAFKDTVLGRYDCLVCLSLLTRLGAI
jgi:HSF-type DNA-binding